MTKLSFTTFLASYLICFSLSSYAQNEQLIILDEGNASQAVYQIYLGDLQAGESLGEYEDASHLGFLRTFSIQEPPKEQGSSRANAPKKVFLGPFLGKETAEKMMDKILDLGYIDAYLEQDVNGLQTATGTQLSYSVQLGAFEKLNMNQFTKIANVPAHGVYVLYEDGLFKVLSGLYPSAEKEYLRKSVIPYMSRVWGMSGFVRRVDQAPPTVPNE